MHITQQFRQVWSYFPRAAREPAYYNGRGPLGARAVGVSP